MAHNASHKGLTILTVFKDGNKPASKDQASSSFSFFEKNNLIVLSVHTK